MTLPHGTPTRTQKLIAFGSFPTPAYLATNAATLDSFPYDGCVFQVPIGASYLQYLSWGSTAITYSDFADSASYLQGAALPNMRHNLPILNARPVHGASTPFDWFNAAWATNIVNNFALTARFCAECNLPGFLFDAEPYEGNVWDWNAGTLPGWTSGNWMEVYVQAWSLGRRCATAMRAESANVQMFTTTGARDVDQGNNLYLYTAFLIGFASALGYGGKTLHLGNENTYVETGDGTTIAYYSHAGYEDIYSAYSALLPVSTHSSKFMAISPSGGTEDWDTGVPENNFHTPTTLKAALGHLFLANDTWSWMYFRGTDLFTIEAIYLDAIREARALAGLRVW